MIRESGLYATRDGVEFAVAYATGASVAMRKFEGDPATDNLVKLSALSRLQQVRLIADWREHEIEVQRVLPNQMVWILTHDEDSAGDLRLYGSRETGWAAAVPMFELGDLREDVRDLLPF